MQPSSFWQRGREWVANLAQRGREWARRQPRWRLALLGIGGPILLGLLFVLLLTVMVWGGMFGPIPTYGDLKNISSNQASQLISEDGEVLGKYYIENRTNAQLSEISPHLINALIATEDSRFFEHRGIDMRAFARVLVKSIVLRDESAGGGSTLSQQLAKNLYGRQDYLLLEMPINKLREILTARRLEKLYSKEELLAMYLNTVPFGDNAFGIKVASRRFFNKDPKNLKVEEAAVLVGMLKAVTTYNPRRNPERAMERRNVVLTQMVRNGKLDAEQAEQLKAQPIKLDFQPESHNEGLATYFREHLRREVDAILKDYTKEDGTPYNLYTDGLKIYTTIDSRMQRYAERAVREQMPKIQQNFHQDWAKRKELPWEKAIEDAIQASNRYQWLDGQGYSDQGIRKEMAKPVEMTIFDWEEGARDTLMSPLDSIRYYTTLLNTGLLAAEPGTGLVRAWVGGIDHRFIQFDHVRSERQIGSTMKPVVYAAALQQGMLPCEYMPNQRQTYSQFASYSPGNSDGQYGGAYSMMGALSKSVNTIAVEIGMRAGLPNVVNLARKMGIDGEIPQVPGIALGAVEASLIDMVQVYSTFANRGRTPTRLHYLDRIETADGQVIVDFDRPESDEFKQTLNRMTAETMTYLLVNVVNQGTAARLRGMYNIPVSIGGKTGTTQDQSDGWFLGFTPHLTVGVWVGAEMPAVQFRTLNRGQAASTALPIWGQFVHSVYADKKFAKWRNKGFPALADTTMALLQCPPYLPEMPIFFDPDSDNYEELAGFQEELEGVSPERLQEILQETPRREGENLEEYGERIRRESEQAERREERQENGEEKRKDFWSKLLFGKKKKDENDDGGN